MRRELPPEGDVENSTPDVCRILTCKHFTSDDRTVVETGKKIHLPASKQQRVQTENSFLESADSTGFLSYRELLPRKLPQGFNSVENSTHDVSTVDNVRKLTKRVGNFQDQHDDHSSGEFDPV